MEELRSYILSVTAAAVFCAMIKTLAGKGTIPSILKIMSGVVLVSVILQPLLQISSLDLRQYLNALNADSVSAVEEGMEASKSALRTRISESCCAYILDKAAQYGQEIQVEVQLDAENMIPIGVDIRADVSAAVRKELEAMIYADLGIPPEDQKWN